jgi:hypothetical protein
MKNIICSFANEKCCITDITIVIIGYTSLGGGPWPPVVFFLGSVTIFTAWFASLTPNPQPRGPGYPFFVWFIALALFGM